MRGASRRGKRHQRTLRVKREHEQGCDLPWLAQKLGYEAKQNRVLVAREGNWRS